MATQDSIIQKILGLRQSSNPGKVEDGTPITCVYEKMEGSKNPETKAAKKAKDDAVVAIVKGLPLNRYTGTLTSVHYNADNELFMTMFVKLERENQYRSFNLSKGNLKELTVLG